MNQSQVNEWRSHFPILSTQVNGYPLTYLDNAATTQKPKAVIESISNHYASFNANVHRGVYELSRKATDAYENARCLIQKFINASSPSEVIFTKSATESINLVASSYGESFLSEGDEILLTVLEHHANIIPWQQIAKKKGCIIRVVPIHEDGTLDLEMFRQLLTEKTKFVSMVWISNAIGVENPIHECISIAHEQGVPILIDASQAVLHKQIDVQDLDCDFLVFSGHKVYGPSGTGILYGKSSLLNSMPPYQTGGDMIKKVTFEHTTFADLPSKFEAGTPNIEGIIGLGTAIEFLEKQGIDRIAAHERELMNHAVQMLTNQPFVKIIGFNGTNVSAISFTMSNAHPHDIAGILDTKGICVRAGHHCAHPLMQFYKVPSTTRISFAMYTTKEEVEICIKSLEEVYILFS